MTGEIQPSETQLVNDESSSMWFEVLVWNRCRDGLVRSVGEEFLHALMLHLVSKSSSTAHHR